MILGIFYASVFQTGFREWLPGVLLKQAEFAWDKICNHIPCGCGNIDT